ncbi:MAG: CHASE4 domain-containing protein, partial [Dehalobacterium sp.]
MMSLRKKTYLLIMSVTAALFMFAYFILSQFLMKSYIVLEEKHTAESMGRVDSAIQDEFDDLHITQGDWALWDDTYHFVQHLNTDYSYNNLSYEALANLKINFIVYLDTSGKIVFSKGIDLINEEDMPIPVDLVHHIENNPAFFSHTNISFTNIGFLQSDQGLILISSRPITKSDGKEPVGGNLIMGRYFNMQEIAHLSEVTHLPVSIVFSNDALKEKIIFDGITKEPVFVRAENDKTIKAWSPLDDIYGKQVALLEIELPRDIYLQGQTSIAYLLLFIVVIGLCLAGIILLMMEKLVLSRIVRLGASVNQIATEGNISSRIFIEGNDELFILSNKINDMLDNLERSQKDIQISEEKFRIIYDKLPIGLVMFDKEGNIFGVNKAFVGIFGFDLGEMVIGKNIFSDPNIKEEIKEQIYSTQSTCFELEYDFDLVRKMDLYRTSRSGKHYFDCVINPIQVKSISFNGFLGQVQNITQRKLEEEQLKYLSFFDNLSGLYNRAYFEDKVMHLESQDIDQVSVIMCDVDGLKLANDSFGHGAGDSLLKAAAHALRDCFRKEDIVARIGGDEFAVLLPGADLNMVEKARDRIQAAVERYNQTYRPVIPLRISLGLAS